MTKSNVAQCEVLPFTLYTGTQIQAIDAAAIASGVPGIVLMERAAAASFSVLRENWPDAKAIFIVCGVGNNGGDGLVLARLALEAGLKPTVVLCGAPESMIGDAHTTLVLAEQAGVSIVPHTPGQFGCADVIVDALFGIGISRSVQGAAHTVVTAMNEAQAPVLGMDIPSGLHPDTGVIFGVAVRCAVTVTFIGLKRGLYTGEGPNVVGELYFSGLGISDCVINDFDYGLCRKAGIEDLAAYFPRRLRTAHKGHFGHVLVVGGDFGYAGAALLCAQASSRSGGGLTSLATRTAHAALSVISAPEVMARGVEDADDLGPLLERATTVAIGPGLGQADWGEQLLMRCLQACTSMVVDADALNLLALRHVVRSNWVLTPHPAEAGRLLGVGTKEVQMDRFAAARNIAQRYGGVCILKGAGTVVADERRFAVVTTGNPGMASGGSGDVLTGIVAAALAQGLEPFDAAVAGACAHGHAGDLAAVGGERGLLASDLLAHLRRAVNPCL
jgi:ADP-dependent NAD(P)H-hydrate dehydratase / NAD(P)H-hydrate epimerase